MTAISEQVKNTTAHSVCGRNARENEAAAMTFRRVRLGDIRAKESTTTWRTGDGEITADETSGPTLKRLEKLCEAANLQRNRVIELFEKEKRTGVFLAVLGNEMKLYGDLLHAIQNMRFDLGLDEYKGPKPVRRTRADAQRRKE
jgi:hypothetical protein